MTEIKFRAWNPATNQWLYFTIPEIADTKLGFINSLEHWSQYTGLKDKNGKEIYIGDIIEVVEDQKTTGKVQENGDTLWNVIDKGLRFEVDWNSMTPRIELYPIPMDDSNIDMERVMLWLWDNDGGSENLEVIGNIYENPGLLK